MLGKPQQSKEHGQVPSSTKSSCVVSLNKIREGILVLLYLYTLNFLLLQTISYTTINNQIIIG